ncbi:MAG: winged helix-turn-helix transcriptional regulator [Promethearchaeota archaeon]
MKKSSKRDEYLSSKAIFKGLIRFLLFRDGELTAKQLQVKTGLKRQSCYNYLKELKEEGKVRVRSEKDENRSNIIVTYYSIKHEPPPRDYDTLSERIKHDSMDDEKMLTRIKSALEANIGALLEISTAINRMKPQEVAKYVKCDPIVWGFYGFTALLTDEEYSELITEFKSLYDRLNAKWERNNTQDTHSGNVFTFTFYKTIPE